MCNNYRMFFKLVSPDDLVNASRQFESLHLPLRYINVLVHFVVCLLNDVDRWSILILQAAFI